MLVLQSVESEMEAEFVKRENMVANRQLQSRECVFFSPPRCFGLSFHSLSLHMRAEVVPGSVARLPLTTAS